MVQGLFDCVASLVIGVEKALNEVFCWVRYFAFKSVPGFENLQVQIFHVISLKGHCAIQHGKQNYTRTPEVGLKSLVALVSDNFGSNVCWSAALLVHDLTRLDLLAHSEVANFYVALSVQKNVV